MSKRTYRATVTTAAMVVAASAWIGWPAAATSSLATCDAGYAYAGIAGRQTAQGVAATVSAASMPAVTVGHVAGWVGLGAASAWIQAGLSRLPGRQPSVYTEVRLPGSKPSYSAVEVARTNVRYRIRVVMEPGERWIVRVNRRLVAGPVHLPGSAAWRPVVTGESWLPTAGTCNKLSYRFRNVATKNGSSWKPLTALDVLHRGEPYTVTRAGASFFVASR